ncbi:OmpA family protein [Candidatus Saccharibacteria bacterium]|nr:OmpA family protein [Candidatus Saccharibacteria bacterium]
MKPKFKVSKKKPNNNIKLVILGILVFLLLISGLGFIVYRQNEEQCQKIGLRGSLFSCKIDKKYEFASIAFVAGNTANSPVPVLTKTTKKFIQNSINIEDSVVDIFSATPSHPRINYKEERQSTNSQDDIAAMEEKADLRIEAVSKAIQTSPTESGAAYLEAVLRAGRSALNKATDFENGKAAVIVIGSGLSDSGVLNFTNTEANLIDKSPSEIVETLKDNEIITEKELSGLTIYWSGLGETVAPQAELNDSMREKLQEIYTEVLEEAGARVRGFSPIESDELKSVETTYTVKTVQTQDSSGNIWGKSIDEYSSLFFEGNSDKFAQESDPSAVITPYIEQMKRDDSIKAQIVGYVARLNCNSEPDHNLALNRANAVKQLMINAGIDESRISTKSGGFGEEDECASSAYPDEAIRKKNRKIVINKL